MDLATAMVFAISLGRQQITILANAVLRLRERLALEDPLDEILIGATFGTSPTSKTGGTQHHVHFVWRVRFRDRREPEIEQEKDPVRGEPERVAIPTTHLVSRVLQGEPREVVCEAVEPAGAMIEVKPALSTR